MTTDNHGASTSFTPPPAFAPQSAVPAPQDSPSPLTADRSAGRSSGATAVMIVTAVVGGIALLGTGGSAAAGVAESFLVSSRPDSVQTVGIDGVEGIEVEADASSMRVEFGDVDEAELAITNGRGHAWTFERDGDELIVRSPQGVFGWWFDNWFGDHEEIAVLTLPTSLRSEGLAADLTLVAGSLDVDGDFGMLDVTVSAGALDVAGTAEELDVQMSAGRADLVLDGITAADLGVAAGDLTIELTGTPPAQTTIDVTAGTVDLTVPDVEYEITQSVSAGTLNAKVDTVSSARRTIDVSLSAGTATIRPGR